MIEIGSDHNGFELKCRLLAHLAERKIHLDGRLAGVSAPVATGGLRC
jgi:ribose 5-phosphate isomerase RpiB